MTMFLRLESRCDGGSKRLGSQVLNLPLVDEELVVVCLVNDQLGNRGVVDDQRHNCGLVDDSPRRAIGVRINTCRVILMSVQVLSKIT